jgi:hypothetical protein
VWDTSFGLHHTIEHELDGVDACALVAGLYDQLGIGVSADDPRRRQQHVPYTDEY